MRNSMTHRTIDNLENTPQPSSNISLKIIGKNKNIDLSMTNKELAPHAASDKKINDSNANIETKSKAVVTKKPYHNLSIDVSEDVIKSNEENTKFANIVVEIENKLKNQHNNDLNVKSSVKNDEKLENTEKHSEQIPNNNASQKRSIVSEMTQVFENRFQSQNEELDNHKIATIENNKETSSFLTNLNDEQQKELERKRERIYSRFEEQENKEEKENPSQKNEEDEDVDPNYRLKHRLTHAKKRTEIQHRKSMKIMEMAKKLENHMQQKTEEEIKQEIKEIDDYTKILLNKPINNKKGRKFTRFNFVLEETN